MTPALPKEWQRPLTDSGLNARRVRGLVRDAYCGADTHAVYPLDVSRVFRAFSYGKPDEVRVVILGQDPYYAHPEQADGLAFSVPRLDASVPAEVRFPPSLQTIFANLTIDDQLAFAAPTDGGVPVGDLRGWAQQGVLLLNTALTVSQGAPGSQNERWREFTDLLIEILNDQQAPIAFMLWGRDAQSRAHLVSAPHAVFPMPHPAQPAQKNKSSAWRSGKKLPFSDVNGFLRSAAREPIDWCRTSIV